MNQIAKREPSAVVDWSDEVMREYIKNKYAPKSTPEEFIEFVNVAKMSDANPFLKEIYFIPYDDHPGSIQFSIHWMVKKAHETGVFRGFTLPKFRDKNGVWYDEVWPDEAEGQAPTHCKIGVIRSDHPEPLWAMVSWKERVKTYGEWRNQPIHMIVKCAKAEALRCAVPGLSTYHIVDEMHEDDPPLWRHEDRLPSVKEVSEHGKAKHDLRKGVIDPNVESIAMKERNEIKRLGAELGLSGAEAKKRINAILDDHGMDEVKDTSELTVAGGNVVLAAFMNQLDGTDLAEEKDETGLFNG